MNTLKKLLCGGLALALCLSLAACEKEETPPSSLVEESSALPAVTPSPTPTAEPTPEPESSFFEPAPDLIPPGESAPEPGSFEALFSQNAIDKAYDADYAAASSFALMCQACDTAARRWKDMVETAYQAAQESLSGSDKEAAALREDQEKWREISERRIQHIREDADDSNEGFLTAAREIVLLYRDRAMELCRQVYERTGALPDFPDVSQAPLG